MYSYDQLGSQHPNPASTPEMICLANTLMRMRILRAFDGGFAVQKIARTPSWQSPRPCPGPHVSHSNSAAKLRPETTSQFLDMLDVPHATLKL